jgi:hypothetical protein
MSRIAFGLTRRVLFENAEAAELLVPLLQQLIAGCRSGV